MTTLYHVSKAAEPDYLKLLHTAHPENQLVYQGHLKRYCETASLVFGYQIEFTSTYVRSFGDGRHQYAYEFSGQNAYVIYELPASTFHPDVARLDVKRRYDMTGDGFAEVKKLVEQGNTGRMNFSTNRSRVRQKTDKRDGGGVSFAVGSHKSDYRLNVCKRGKEGGYVEGMFKNKKVQFLLDTARDKVRTEESSRNFWRYTVEYAWDEVVNHLVKITGLSIRYVEAIATGDLPVDRSELEADMARIEAQTKQLPREGAAAIVSALHEYFGFTQEELDLSL